MLYTNAYIICIRAKRAAHCSTYKRTRENLLEPKNKIKKMNPVFRWKRAGTDEKSEVKKEWRNNNNDDNINNNNNK